MAPVRPGQCSSARCSETARSAWNRWRSLTMIPRNMAGSSTAWTSWGEARHFPAIAEERGADEVIIAIPRTSGANLRRIVALCESIGVPARTLPGVQELLDQTVSVNQVRPIRVEDLLRREPAAIPLEPLKELVSARCVLITGAAGSIGSEVCRQAAGLAARRLLLLDLAESPLFFVDQELRRRFPSVEVVPILADVADEAAVRRVFERERPDVVLHAAAHKHVPLSESNVGSTVWTNVRGTRVVAEAARDASTPVLIFISTDKAVDPCSVMGATKRLGEQIVKHVGETAQGRFVIVRFGNVLGSQGSVVEIFRQQIEAGGPLTVTHPDMTRFFMTIPEAVRLILLAGAVGRRGDICVLNMGEPIRIQDLAREMIRLALPRGGKEIRIEFTGLRPGEKLEETLFAPDEESAPAEDPHVLVARHNGASAYDEERVASVEQAAARGDDDAARAMLRLVQ